LEDMKLESIPVIPGEIGLDVYVPLTGPVLHDSVRRFAREVARLMATHIPECSLTPDAGRGPGWCIHLDIRGNEAGGTVLAPHLPRPTSDASVVTPLSWKQVKPSLDPRSFTLETVLERSEDPLRNWLTTRQQLPRLG